jgi:hypothetical protein
LHLLTCIRGACSVRADGELAFRCSRQPTSLSTCGLVAMTSASHAEGRQFDPGQVYFSPQRIAWAGKDVQMLAVVQVCIAVAFSQFALSSLRWREAFQIGAMAQYGASSCVSLGQHLRRPSGLECTNLMRLGRWASDTIWRSLQQVPSRWVARRRM